MAFPATMKHSLSISLSVGAILSGISRRNCKFELSLEEPGQGVCNLHLLMQAAAIQGEMLQRLTVVPLRLYHDLTLERKDLLGFLGYRHPKNCVFIQRFMLFFAYNLLAFWASILATKIH